MKAWTAWASVGLAAGGMTLALTAPIPWLLLALGLALVEWRRRLPFFAFAALTVLISGAMVGLLDPGGAAWAVGPLRFGAGGFVRGAAGGVRLAGVLLVNVWLFDVHRPAALLDGLRLPRRATAWLGAIVVAAHDIGRDAKSMLEAARMAGPEANTRRGRWRTASRLLPALMVAAARRARTRREALALAGIRTGRWFAPIIAVTALAVAGRLALVAIPNVSLTFVIVFLGGVVWGARVGAAAGLLSMAVTDLMLTGLLPTAFVNAPAMALVGAAGGAFRLLPPGPELADRVGDRLLAAAIGVFATLAFSVAADSLEWLLVPEFRATPGFWTLRVSAGLAFNVVPAIANGFLFALSVGPVRRAFAAYEPSQAPAPQPSK